MNLLQLSFIGFVGGGGYTPTAPPQVPKEDSPEMKAAAEEAARKERELARKRKGRRSTIKTTALGLKDDPMTRYAHLTGKTKLGEGR